MGKRWSKRRGEWKVNSGKHSENIQRLRSDLSVLVDIECGLLSRLCELGVITHQQVEEVQSEPTRTRRAEHLLNLVIEMSDEQQEQFLIALDSQQMHVSEYIRANGDPSKLDQERRPLHLCNEMRIIENNWTKLTDLIDLKCGLLDKLYAVGFLNERQMKSIKDKQGEAVQNEEFLNLMYRISFADFQKFLECLENTNQCAVLPLLSARHTGSQQPLNDVRKSRLRNHYAHLVELIDLENGLLAALYESNCITLRQKQFVKSATTRADCNARLLEILRRGSEENFNKFIEGLAGTGQEHVVKLFMKEGTMAHLVATTGSCASDERHIVEQFKTILSNSSDRENLFNEVDQHMNELRSRGVEITAFAKENSIGLFYFCHSLDALHHLYELFSSGQLKEVVERMFTVLLNNGTPVVVDCLRWDIRNCMTCMQCLYSAANLQVFYELYELPTNTHLDLIYSTMSSSRVDQLPSEPLQLMLNKAMGQLFVIIHRVTPRAAVYAMATLGGVSTTWWRTITCRRYNKRVLKRYFQHVCSPFKCNPQRLQSLRIEGNVNCLTELNDQLYVGVSGSASIQVFVSRSPFSRLDDIIVQGLNDPWDIVVCRDTNQLYIANGGSEYAIWRVNLLRNKQVDEFITIQWLPLSLSVNSRRLLITSSDGAALFLYSDDGSLLNRIKLPDYMYATHAVETTHNTYIVSHSYRWMRDTKSEHNSVSEVNVDGRVVRTFNSQHIDIGSIQFKRPFYLTLDEYVIVADLRNERVVVLQSDLQLKRVLIPPLDRQPMRLCLSKSTGLLFISYMYSSDIDIYKVVS